MVSQWGQRDPCSSEESVSRDVQMAPFNDISFKNTEWNLGEGQSKPTAEALICVPSIEHHLH